MAYALFLCIIINLYNGITCQDIKVKVNPAFMKVNEVKSLFRDVSKLRGWIGEWDTPELVETLHYAAG